MNGRNWYRRLVVGAVCTAVALHVIWVELKPVLPWLAVGVILATLWRVVAWWRDRW